MDALTRERLDAISAEIAKLQERIGDLKLEWRTLWASETEAKSPFARGDIVLRTIPRYGGDKHERLRIWGFDATSIIAIRLRADGSDGATVRLNTWDSPNCQLEADHA